MQPVFRKFATHRQAERASREYFLRLTPEKRLEILLELIDRAREHTHAPAQGLERVYRIAKLSPR